MGSRAQSYLVGRLSLQLFKDLERLLLCREGAAHLGFSSVGSSICGEMECGVHKKNRRLTDSIRVLCRLVFGGERTQLVGRWKMKLG